MTSSSNQERGIALLLGSVGAGLLAWAWTVGRPPHLSAADVWLAGLLTVAILLADRFPIHILRGTKISLINLPIFLAAALLPTPLAVSTAALGLGIANYRARVERGLLATDLLTYTAHWVVLTFLGNRITLIAWPGLPPELLRDKLLVASAASFLLGDFALFAMTQSVIVGEPFLTVLRAVFKQGLSLELTQYLIAVLGALVADEHPWALGLLLVPVLITYVAFKNLKETRFETVRILEDMADTVDLRDVYTGGHSKRVAELVHEILAQICVSGPEASLIEIAARLHDIGKIGIPDSILQKPARLLPEEMAVMRTHSQKGADLIAKYRDFARGAEIIRHHHERWDGQGYPSGLRAHEIPFGARVIAVADSFDAMTSDRPYRKALSVQQALQILREGCDRQWDASIVGALLATQLPQAADPAPVTGPFKTEPA